MIRIDTPRDEWLSCLLELSLICRAYGLPMHCCPITTSEAAANGPHYPE